MNVLDPGHVYELEWLDVEPGFDAEALEGSGCRELRFVKREGAGYPGNVGRHAGTTIQETLRALIDRVKYLDNQIPHEQNRNVLRHLRLAIWNLELRAAERHGRTLPPLFGQHQIEDAPVCPKCLHIGCEGACHP